MELDFDASLAKLSKWLATFRGDDWTPTESVKELHKLGQMLETTARALEGHRWIWLEQRIDSDPEPEIGTDGWPIKSDETNAGTFQGTIRRIQLIADAANQLAGEYPNSRARPELEWAADIFLRIWLEAGKDRPLMSDKSEAVIKFQETLSISRLELTNGRVRGLLSSALNKFDPHYCPSGLDLRSFLVWRQ